MQPIIKTKTFWIFITYIAFTSTLLILILIFAHESKASEDLLDIYVKTNQIEYKENEPVDIVIQNHGENDVTMINIAVEKYLVDYNEWEIVDEDINCSCNTLCESKTLIVSIGTTETFSWQQDTDKLQAGSGRKPLLCANADSGKYRIRITYFDPNKASGKLEIKTVYSNEFEINNGVGVEAVGSYTDKIEYKENEPVDIVIQNHGENDVTIINIAVEKHLISQNNWEIVDRDIKCPCNAKCSKVNTIIPIGDTKTFSWQQDTDKLQTGSEGKLSICAKADSGKYRIKITYFDPNKASEELEIKIVYSNEFKINNGVGVEDININATINDNSLIKSFEVVEEGSDFVFFDISFNSSNIPDDDQLFVSAITLTDGKSLGYWGSTNAHVQKGTASRIRIGMGPDSPSYCSDEIKIQVYSEEKSFESFIAPYEKCWQRSTVVFQKPSFPQRVKKFFTWSKQETITDEYTVIAPLNAVVVSGSVPSKEWLNIDRFPISLNDALTSSPISDAGFANIAKGTVIDFVFEDPIVNNDGDDLLLVEARFDPGAYEISTDYDNFTSSIFVNVSNFTNSDTSKMYHYGAYPNRGPFKASEFISPIDLSTIGVPNSEEVSIIRLTITGADVDLLGIGKLRGSTNYYFSFYVLRTLAETILVIGTIGMIYFALKKLQKT